MEIILIIKHILLLTSFGTLIFGLIFLFSFNLYCRIEQMLSFDIIPETEFFAILEGKINFLNDWIVKYRAVFGAAFVILSFYNIKNLIAL